MKISSSWIMLLMILLMSSALISYPKQYKQCRTALLQNKTEKTQTVPSKSKTEEDKESSPQTQQTKPLKKECVFKKDAPSADKYYDELRKILADYRETYPPIVLEMLKSDDIETVKKALVYLHWFVPLNKFTQIREQYEKLSKNEQLTKLNFPVFICNYDWKQISSDDYKFKRFLYHFEYTLFSNSVILLKIFDKDNAENKADPEKFAKRKTETIKVMLKYFTKKFIMEFLNYHFLYASEYEKEIDNLKATMKEKEGKSNGYFYPGPKEFDFLKDEKYKDDRLEKMMTKFRDKIVENIKSPHEVVFDNSTFRMYKLTMYFYVFGSLKFFNDGFLEWAKKLNPWIKDTIEDCNKIIKDGSYDEKGNIKYFDYNIGVKVAKTLGYMYRLWFEIAPIKASEFITQTIKDIELLKYYADFVFTSYVYDDYFESYYYLQNHKISIKTFLDFMEEVYNKFEDKRDHVREEIVRFAMKTAYYIVISKFLPEYGKYHYLNERFREFTFDDWRDFFDIQ